MGADFLESKGVKWHHLSGVTDGDIGYLKAHFKFHHLDYDDIRAASPISKMDAYKHYLFFVFQLPMIDSGGRVRGEPVFIFLSKDDLTFLSAALMVPTLVAGFYGMNVLWLPFAQSPAFVGSLYVFGLLGMFFLVLVAVRRGRRM